MRNETDVPYQVKKGSKIAQGILEKYLSAIPIETTELEGTQRSQKGFGSTTKGNKKVKPIVKIASTKSITDDQIEDVKIKLPYNIYLSHDPYNNQMEHKVMVKGNHKTLGMQFTLDPMHGKLKLKQCLPGTPSA